MDLIATLPFEDVQLCIRDLTVDCSFYGEFDFKRGRRGTFELTAMRLTGTRGGRKVMTDVDSLPHASPLADWLWPCIKRQYASEMTAEMERLEAEHYTGQSYADEHRLRVHEVL